MTKKIIKYDLEERTFQFTRNIGFFVKKIPRDFVVREYCTQLVRASGSIGANYIEANEALIKKIF